MTANAIVTSDEITTDIKVNGYVDLALRWR